jgi:hypothetical protein
MVAATPVLGATGFADASLEFALSPAWFTADTT